MADNAGPSKVPPSLRVTGAWTGLIEVLLDEWTVKGLREEVSRRSGFRLSSVKMISLGRTLKDFNEGEVTSPTLREAGFKENTRVLITRVGAELGNTVNEEKDRSERLCRLKAAVEEDAQTRGIKDVSGHNLIFTSPASQRALVTGLMLHENGRRLIRRAQYKEASEVLALAEEAFSQCDAKVLEPLDNPAFLHLDMIWCWLQLREISRLTPARERLSKVREMLKRPHGSNLERLREQFGDVSPELAIYVRLELLEGVVSFHSGNYAAARQSLVSANTRYQELQVSDSHMAQLAAEGFQTVESTTALLTFGHNVEKAINFLTEDRRKKRAKEELESFGRTPGGKAVKRRRLDNLVSMGYDKREAAEALRLSGNNIGGAVEVLSNPNSLLALQTSLDRILPTGLVGTGPAPQSSSETTPEVVREAIESPLQRLPPELSLQTETNPTKTAETAVQDATSISNVAAATAETHDAGQNTHEHADRKEEVQDEHNLEDLADQVRDYNLEKERDAIEQYLALLEGH